MQSGKEDMESGERNSQDRLKLPEALHLPLVPSAHRDFQSTEAPAVSSCLLLRRVFLFAQL